MQTCWNIIFRQILYALNIVRLQYFASNSYCKSLLGLFKWPALPNVHCIFAEDSIQAACHLFYRLFPIRESGMNFHAQELQCHEINVCTQNFSFCIYLYTYKTWCDDLVVIRACTTKLKVICIGILITTVKKKKIINRNIYN